MTTPFTEKERAFVEGLAAETGRDLGGWMTAIADSGLGHRNDIIDWLRQQGFTFANASWLERIHHNGGRLIYGDIIAKPASVIARRTPSETAAAPVQVKAAPPVRPALLAAGADAGIDALLNAAKAYRPLAQVLLRDILAAVPGADANAESGLIVISHTHPFAAIAATSKEVRLLLAVAAPPAGGQWIKTRLPPGMDNLSSLSHLLVLTDARQLTGELRNLIAASARTAGR